MNASELVINLDTIAIACTPEEIGAAFAALLREMRTVARLLRADERLALRKIMSQQSGTLTVADVFLGFTRESEAHKTLRRLRAAQFIRPARTGRWAPEEPIEVKPFARLMWDHVGETEICSPSRGVHVITPTEQVNGQDRTAVGWDDDDVFNDIRRPIVDEAELPTERSHFT